MGGNIPDFLSTIEDLINSFTRTSQKYHENAIEIVIQDRRYEDKYLHDEKYKNHKVIGIGLCFSSLNCYLIDKGAWEISSSGMVTLL